MRGANTLKRGGTFRCQEEIDGIKGEVWHRQYVFLDVHNPHGCGMLTKKRGVLSFFLIDQKHFSGMWSLRSWVMEHSRLCGIART